jgi:TolB protein
MCRLSKTMLVVGAFALALAMSSLVGATGNSQSRREGTRVDTRIVFTNNHLCKGNDCGKGEIAAINFNGTGFKRLTHNTVTDHGPAWSPGKRRIAFTSMPALGASRFGLWVMDANGRHQRRLPSPAFVTAPDWSPNGRAIVFGGGDSGNSGFAGLWTENVRTGQLTRQIWSKSSSDAPAWSPDGTRIAFGSNRIGGEQIWVLRLRDHQLRQLTQGPTQSYTPVWSPDGRRIAVWRSGYIWVIRADGSHARRVGGPADEFTWSADGKWIVFSAGSLYAIHPDGTGRHTIRHEAGGSNGWVDLGPDG